MKQVMNAISISMMTALLTVSCSVKDRSVVNEPPVIKKGLVKHDTDFGSFDMESVTLFYWPEGLNEQEAQSLVRTVNSASNELDEVQGKLIDNLIRLNSLEETFTDCKLKYADPDTNGDGVVDKKDKRVDKLKTIKRWIVLDAADPEYAVKKAEMEKCQQDQEDLESLPKINEQLLSTDIPRLGGIIYKTIDPGYPEKIENSKSVNAKESTLSIQPSENGLVVDVTFKDFIHKGHTVSTEIQGPGQIRDASYNPETKLLKFSIPELNADGQPTGSHLEFYLERGPNIKHPEAGSLARFKGDVKLVKDGQVLRYGSAKLDCLMKK